MIIDTNYIVAIAMYVILQMLENYSICMLMTERDVIVTP